MLNVFLLLLVLLLSLIYLDTNWFNYIQYISFVIKFNINQDIRILLNSFFVLILLGITYFIVHFNNGYVFLGSKFKYTTIFTMVITTLALFSLNSRINESNHNNESRLKREIISLSMSFEENKYFALFSFIFIFSPLLTLITGKRDLFIYKYSICLWQISFIFIVISIFIIFIFNIRLRKNLDKILNTPNPQRINIVSNILLPEYSYLVKTDLNNGTSNAINMLRNQFKGINDQDKTILIDIIFQANLRSINQYLKHNYLYLNYEKIKQYYEQLLLFIKMNNFNLGTTHYLMALHFRLMTILYKTNKRAFIKSISKSDKYSIFMSNCIIPLELCNHKTDSYISNWLNLNRLIVYEMNRGILSKLPKFYEFKSEYAFVKSELNYLKHKNIFKKFSGSRNVFMQNLNHIINKKCIVVHYHNKDDGSRWCLFEHLKGHFYPGSNNIILGNIKNIYDHPNFVFDMMDLWKMEQYFSQVPDKPELIQCIERGIVPLNDIHKIVKHNKIYVA